MYAIFKLDRLRMPPGDMRIGGPPRKATPAMLVLQKTTHPKFESAEDAAETLNKMKPDGNEYVVIPYFDKRTK